MKGSLRVALASSVVAVVVVTGFVTNLIEFRGTFEKNVSNIISQELNEVGIQTKKIFEAKIDDSFENLEEISEELIGEEIFDSDTSIILMKKNGTIIPPYEEYIGSDNLFTYLEDAELKNAVSLETFINSVKDEHSDLLIYQKNGEDFYLQYLPLEINDLYLVINTSSSSVRLHYDKIEDDYNKLLIKSVLYFMIIIFFILIVLYITVKRMRKNNHELMVKSNELKASEERFRIISEQTHDILYEFDFETHHLYVSPTFKKKFGYELTLNNIKNCLSLHPEDTTKFRKMVKHVFKKSNYGVCEVRIRNINGKYFWCSLHNTIVMENDNKISKMIGKVVDIDKRKKDIENLTELSKRDPLTKVYNKTTIQEMIDDFFSGEGKSGRHAFIFLDIDNFKAINDNLGHSFGDNVLADISTSLKEIYADNNFIGRIGGDEFVALFKDIGSIDVVTEKAEEICSLLRSTYTGENNDYSISGSIGIALYPDDGTNYFELYTKADEALYDAKTAGKNQYIIYGSNPVNIQLINISQG